MQLLGSLRFMAQQRVVHCDLKPENILLVEPNKARIKACPCPLCVTLRYQKRRSWAVICSSTALVLRFHMGQQIFRQQDALRYRERAWACIIMHESNRRLMHGHGPVQVIDFWQQLLRGRAPVHIHPEPLLPLARGAAGAAVRARHRRVEHGLHPG